MKKILFALLATLALVFPASPSSADAIDEQYVPTLPAAKDYQGYLSMEANELQRFGSSLLSFVSGGGKVDSVTACTSLNDAGCGYVDYQRYRALIPRCEAGVATDCVSAITANDESGTALSITQAGYFESKSPQLFKGDPSQNLPTGGDALLFRVPGAPHAGGDLYLLRVEFLGSRDIANTKTFRLDRFQASIWAVKIIDGSFGLTLDSTDTATYTSKMNVMGAVNGPQSSTFNPDAIDCVVKSPTQCAKAYPLPLNISFGFSMEMNQEMFGWLTGRMHLPVISITNGAGNNKTVSVSAQPIQIPIVDIWAKNSDLTPELKAFYSGKPNFGNNFFVDPQYKDILSAPLSSFALRRLAGTSKSIESMNEFLAWLPLASDKAAALPTLWTVQNLVDKGQITRAECYNDVKGITGIVTTNASQYLDGPPQYDKVQQVLNYKVAAPHLTPKGEVFKGVYDLVLRSDVARCIYGFSKAPIRATISVLSENGSPDVATTLINEKNGWLTLGAYGFHYSAPTVQVKLAQDAPAPEATPSVKPTPILKTTVTCIKGKVIKKVTAVNPKCPSGYKKKA